MRISLIACFLAIQKVDRIDPFSTTFPRLNFPATQNSETIKLDQTYIYMNVNFCFIYFVNTNIKAETTCYKIKRDT